MGLGNVAKVLIWRRAVGNSYKQHVFKALKIFLGHQRWRYQHKQQQTPLPDVIQYNSSW